MSIEPRAAVPGEPMPLSTGSLGRDHAGRFAPGNRFGPGNPHTKRVARLRSALLREVTPDELREVVRAMLDRAKGGDVHAADLVLRYTIGRPAPAVGVEVQGAESVKLFAVDCPIDSV